jgi:hypothetical protein
MNDEEIFINEPKLYQLRRKADTARQNVLAWLLLQLDDFVLQLRGDDSRVFLFNPVERSREHNNSVHGGKGLSEFVHRLRLPRSASCDIGPKRNHQLIGFASINEQVDISQDVRKVLEYFVITNDLGVVAAAIQADVDGEDDISHVGEGDGYRAVARARR